MPKAKLSPGDIDLIINLLTGWQGRLTWEMLVDKIAVVMGRTYTRQALDAHVGVKRAFDLAKTRARGGKRPGAVPLSPELETALDRVDALKEEIAVLKRERNGFLEMFATWLYNARNRGLSESDLNQPLPAVERHRSDGR